jgi:hypothetical protein
MEPEGSLLCSQDPSTAPYPEPDRSSSYDSTTLRSILVLSTHLRLGLPRGLSPSGFPTNILYTFLSIIVRHVKTSSLKPYYQFDGVNILLQSEYFYIDLCSGRVSLDAYREVRFADFF